MAKSKSSQEYFIDIKLPLVTVIILSFVMIGLLTSVSPALSQTDDTSFSSPYHRYTLTQGPHGQSYGHLAIDLAAGKGTPIKSPINGVVSANYIDSMGNTTLILENSVYRVTLLHGKYSVNYGDVVKIGQTIGTESNIGYTTDMQGVSCRNRDCGYHTHLNVYDIERGENINPLSLLEE